MSINVINHQVNATSHRARLTQVISPTFH